MSLRTSLNFTNLSTGAIFLVLTRRLANGLPRPSVSPLFWRGIVLFSHFGILHILFSSQIYLTRTETYAKLLLRNEEAAAGSVVPIGCCRFFYCNGKRRNPQLSIRNLDSASISSSLSITASTPGRLMSFPLMLPSLTGLALENLGFLHWFDFSSFVLPQLS